MSELWIALDDFPAEGREFSFPGPDPWAEAWKELAMPGRVEELRADLRITPQGDGALVKGELAGRVALPCDRCAEEFGLEVREGVTVLEELPEEAEDPDARIREEGGILHLNVGAVVWEQLMLALPRHPVCSTSCKGLCDVCGANRNTDPCDCDRKAEDPRMAVFRGLKL